MKDQVQFRTARMTGRAPSPQAAELYVALFGLERASDKLIRDRQEWDRHQIAPWVLSHAGNPVGVGGFRIGFGEDGLELSFHFMPDVWGHGLATEFVQAALDHAALRLNEDRVFAYVDTDNPASVRVLEKAGFHADAPRKGQIIMRIALRLVKRTETPAPPDA